MLVLTRKAEEQILIGDDIKITLVRVRGNSVRIGIDAPKHIRVVRGELAARDASEASAPIVEREEVFARPEAQSQYPGTTKHIAKRIGMLESSESVSNSGTNKTNDRHASPSTTVAPSPSSSFVNPASMPNPIETTKRAPLSAFVSAT
ncbi:MAG: carbon storage regulator [Rhodopirellula sp.]|nr:carbon storage regulator [Rhodopirellula sp.]